MITEQVISVGAGSVMTESGLKYPTGERDFNVGQTVWTDGDYVLGRQRWGQVPMFVETGGLGFFDIYQNKIRYNILDATGKITADSLPISIVGNSYIACSQNKIVIFKPLGSNTVIYKIIDINTLETTDHTIQVCDTGWNFVFKFMGFKDDIPVFRTIKQFANQTTKEQVYIYEEWTGENKIVLDSFDEVPITPPTSEEAIGLLSPNLDLYKSTFTLHAPWDSSPPNPAADDIEQNGGFATYSKDDTFADGFVQTQNVYGAVTKSTMTVKTYFGDTACTYDYVNGWQANAIAVYSSRCNAYDQILAKMRSDYSSVIVDVLAACMAIIVTLNSNGHTSYYAGNELLGQGAGLGNEIGDYNIPPLANIGYSKMIGTFIVHDMGNRLNVITYAHCATYAVLMLLGTYDSTKLYLIKADENYSGVSTIYIYENGHIVLAGIRTKDMLDYGPTSPITFTGESDNYGSVNMFSFPWRRLWAQPNYNAIQTTTSTAVIMCYPLTANYQIQITSQSDNVIDSVLQYSDNGINWSTISTCPDALLPNKAIEDTGPYQMYGFIANGKLYVSTLVFLGQTEVMFSYDKNTNVWTPCNFSSGGCWYGYGYSLAKDKINQIKQAILVAVQGA